MYTLEQEQKILEILDLQQTVRVGHLSESLQVSPATVRRYLDRLAQSGLIERIHGGARRAARLAVELPVQQRMSQHSQEKRQIGRAAAAMVKKGETIFIGSGTTALEVARHLDGKKITVVTNSIPVVNHLSGSPQASIIGIGGVLRASELSFVGHIAEQALREMFMDKVFIGIPAIDLQAGLTNDYLPEVMTDRTILERGKELIVVADHSKFGKIASAYLAPVERIHTLVTSLQADPAVLDVLRERGVEVVLV
jgi:DeoR/GlpR family transcriptional regulator of sugar metabolism